MSFDKPYEGIKVVDLSQGVAGPYCAMLLARHGAEVVKVEPLEGDWSSALGAVYGDNTAFSVAANLGKKSLALDLRAPEGKAIFRRLAATADAVLNNLRGDQPAKLGLTYDALSGLRPAIVCAHITGYGRKGARAAWPAYDFLMQAEAGFMAVTGEPGTGPNRRRSHPR